MDDYVHPIITMNNKKIQIYFLLILLVGSTILAFFVFRPFLYALILAAIFAIVFSPFHKKVLAYFGNREVLAALCTTIIILIVILAIIIFLGIQIFQEANKLYSSLTDSNKNGIIFNTYEGLNLKLQEFFPTMPKVFINIEQYITQSLTSILKHTDTVFFNLTKFLSNSFVFIISLYYLLKDGPKIKKTIINISPLADTEDEAIFKKLETAVNSVMRGNLTIAIIQGILATGGFIFFGIPNFMLWGTATVVVALIPGIGTAIVIVPAVLFLFLTGKTLFAFGLLLWGVLIVGLIDNLLRPKLIGQGMHMHPLIIFLSVFGGLIFFGPMGFILGPLALSLFLAFLDISLSMIKET